MKVTDPDLLAQTTDIVFDTATKKIEIKTGGAISTDGVTLQCLYSFAKEEWKSDSALIKYPFPFIAITEKKFDVVNGWDFKDTNTKNLIRDAGWALKDNSNVSQEEYMGVITLGTLTAGSQVYYQQASGGASTAVVLTGAVNQAVKIYGDATHGSVNYRNYFKIFVREQGKLFDQSQLSAIGETAGVTYQVYAFPLGNGDDLKVTHLDAAMTGAPYSGMSITYFTTDQARTIGAGSYNFRVIIDGNGGTKEQIYEYVQYQLRQNTDIDAGAQSTIGKTADSLLRFVGDTLITSSGVFIDDFSSVDTNSIEFYDYGGVKRVFPYVAAGTISFNDNLVSDANAIYRMYFTTGFGTASALLVKDKDNADISGNIGGSATKSFTFDYDGNVQGGRSAGTDANITIVAIGLGTAQYVIATGTIVKSNANSFSLVSSLERNYANA